MKNRGSKSMDIKQSNGSNHKTIDRFRQKKSAMVPATDWRFFVSRHGVSQCIRQICILTALALVVIGLVVTAEGQGSTVVLTPITLNVDNSAYAKTKAVGQSDIRSISSNDSSV